MKSGSWFDSSRNAGRLCVAACLTLFLAGCGKGPEGPDAAEITAWQSDLEAVMAKVAAESQTEAEIEWVQSELERAAGDLEALVAGMEGLPEAERAELGRLWKENEPELERFMESIFQRDPKLGDALAPVMQRLQQSYPH